MANPFQIDAARSQLWGSAEEAKPAVIIFQLLQHRSSESLMGKQRTAIYAFAGLLQSRKSASYAEQPHATYKLVHRRAKLRNLRIRGPRHDPHLLSICYCLEEYADHLSSCFHIPVACLGMCAAVPDALDCDSCF